MVPDVHLEIALVPVRHERGIGQTFRKLGVYGLHASRLHLIDIGKGIGLEYPIPVQLSSHGGARLVGSHNRSTLNPLPYLLVRPV